MYRLHKEAIAIVEAYPQLFTSCTRHKDGTATLRLVQFPNNSLLLSIIRYLENDGVNVVHYQMSHQPFTVKLSTHRTIVAESFKELLKRRSLFIPEQLHFEDPISTVEAARLIGVSVVYVRTLAGNGTFDALKIGGVFYVSKASVVTYRTNLIAEAIQYEFGSGSIPLIEEYLSQPPEQLPLKTRVRSVIIKDFDDWCQIQLNKEQ